MQQSLAQVLGHFEYLAQYNGLDVSKRCLLEVVDPKSSSFFRDVEARRNAYTSLAEIVKLLSPKINTYISFGEMKDIWNAFFRGLEDYTVNERGDVGSWIRIACVKGLSTMLEALIGEARSSQSTPYTSWASDHSSFSQYLPLDTYHKAIGNILKQGVERLDNVRQCVGVIFSVLLKLEHPSFKLGEKWSIQGKDLFMRLLETKDSPGWNDGYWLYPKAVRFLDIEIYRGSVLRGLLLSVGSKTSSTQQPVSSAILAYARNLSTVKPENPNPKTAIPSPNHLISLLSNLLAIARENPKLNNTVVPVLHTFNILIEGDALGILLDDNTKQDHDVIMDFMDLATRNIERLRNVQRIEESMKIIVNMVCLTPQEVSGKAVLSLRRFLQHPFPMIRASTAEALYVVLQTKDIDYDEEIEEILLETEWSNDDVTSLNEPVTRVLAYLGSSA